MGLNVDGNNDEWSSDSQEEGDRLEGHRDQAGMSESQGTDQLEPRRSERLAIKKAVESSLSLVTQTQPKTARRKGKKQEGQLHTSPLQDLPDLEGPEGVGQAQVDRSSVWTEYTDHLLQISSQQSSYVFDNIDGI